MLIIRLSRVGKKKHPLYRIIISEKKRDTKGKYLELLGQYDPHTNKAEFKTDRVKHWLSHGAQTSGVVHNLLIDQKIIEGKKLRVANIKKKKKSKDEGEETKPADKKEEAKPAEPKLEAKKEEPKKEEVKPVDKEKSAQGGSASGGKDEKPTDKTN